MNAYENEHNEVVIERDGPVEIRYSVCDARGRLISKRREFATEKAMIRWVEKQEATNDRFVCVDAYSV